MRTVWRRVREFGRKHNLQDQLEYIGNLADRYADDPRICRIVALASRSRRLFGDYDAGGHGMPPRGKQFNHVPNHFPAPLPTIGDPGEPREAAEVRVAAILADLTWGDRRIVRMMYGIGREKRTRKDTARLLGVSEPTITAALRRVRAVARMQAES